MKKGSSQSLDDNERRIFLKSFDPLQNGLENTWRRLNVIIFTWRRKHTIISMKGESFRNLDKWWGNSTIHLKMEKTRERDTVYSPSYNHRDEKRRKFHDPSQNRFKNHVKNINSIVLIPLCNARRIVESIKSWLFLRGYFRNWDKRWRTIGEIAAKRMDNW